MIVSPASVASIRALLIERQKKVQAEHQLAAEQSQANGGSWSARTSGIRHRRAVDSVDLMSGDGFVGFDLPEFDRNVLDSLSESVVQAQLKKQYNNGSSSARSSAAPAPHLSKVEGAPTSTARASPRPSTNHSNGVRPASKAGSAQFAFGPSAKAANSPPPAPATSASLLLPTLLSPTNSSRAKMSRRGSLTSEFDLAPTLTIAQPPLLAGSFPSQTPLVNSAQSARTGATKPIPGALHPLLTSVHLFPAPVVLF